MPAERIVIVGGGPAGFSTAKSYRQAGGRGSVTLLGTEPHLPYERPPLSKELLRGSIDASEVTLEGAGWFSSHAVALRVDVTAWAIDAERGSVATGTRGSPELLEADAIVLATGAEPERPPIPGADHPGVMTFRTLADSRRLVRGTRPGQRVAVVGSGFIGCEIAASLTHRGVAVTLISKESAPQIERLGAGASERIAGWLQELGVELVGDASIAAIHGGREVELQDGRRIAAASVVLASGVRPRGELAAAAGLPTSDGAVVVDAAMRASAGAPDVLAVGDVAYAYNATAGRHLRVEHWGDALAQGEIAGQTLAGGDPRWTDIPGFWSTIGEHTIKYAGWGDGHQNCRFDGGDDGSFAVWYERDGVAVGVLTHDRDEDYERGSDLIANGRPIP